MSQLSATAALQCELVNPKDTQEGEKYLQSSRYQTAATPFSEPQGSSMSWSRGRLEKNFQT